LYHHSITKEAQRSEAAAVSLLYDGHIMMVDVMISPLESPRQGGSNGGQIIKICVF